MFSLSVNTSKKQRKFSQNYRDNQFDKSLENSPCLKPRLSADISSCKNRSFSKLDNNYQISKIINSSINKNKRILELIRKYQTIIQQFLVPLTDGKFYHSFIERVKKLKTKLNSKYSYSIKRTSLHKNSTPGYKQITLCIVEYEICQEI